LRRIPIPAEALPTFRCVHAVAGEKMSFFRQTELAEDPTPARIILCGRGIDLNREEVIVGVEPVAAVGDADAFGRWEPIHFPSRPLTNQIFVMVAICRDGRSKTRSPIE
jgi:hypothetical protein